MLTAAKEGTFSAPSDPCVFFPLAASEGVSKNSRLGFASKNVAPHQGSAWSNSGKALGIQEVVWENCGGSDDSARYYDPQAGRFLSEDPNKEDAAGSLYVYAENAPELLIDPLGTQTLAVGPKNTPEQISAFNGGFAEALRRLNNSDCLKLFCDDGKKKKRNKSPKMLDPVDVLDHTEYHIYPFSGNSKAGAQTNSTNSVFINSNGPFFGDNSTIYIPNDKPGITSLREVPFGSLDEMRAFILLHELGHQVGIFPADLFPFINGTHSLRVLEACFKDVHLR